MHRTMLVIIAVIAMSIVSTRAVNDASALKAPAFERHKSATPPAQISVSMYELNNDGAKVVPLVRCIESGQRSRLWGCTAYCTTGSISAALYQPSGSPTSGAQAQRPVWMGVSVLHQPGLGGHRRLSYLQRRHLQPLSARCGGSGDKPRSVSRQRCACPGHRRPHLRLLPCQHSQRNGHRQLCQLPGLRSLSLRQQKAQLWRLPSAD